MEGVWEAAGEQRPVLVAVLCCVAALAVPLVWRVFAWLPTSSQQPQAEQPAPQPEPAAVPAPSPSGPAAAATQLACAHFCPCRAMAAPGSMAAVHIGHALRRRAVPVLLMAGWHEIRWCFLGRFQVYIIISMRYQATPPIEVKKTMEDKNDAEF